MIRRVTWNVLYGLEIVVTLAMVLLPAARMVAEWFFGIRVDSVSMISEMVVCGVVSMVLLVVLTSDLLVD